jgi:hypothetical protein
VTSEGQLKQEHSDVVADYIRDVQSKKSNAYMLTISRDGETPVRTIIFYTNAIEAAEAYNMYNDWGFAKQYLTVTLYEPNGVVNQKVFKRNQAGDPTFLRQNYYDFSNILKTLKPHLEKELYEDACIKAATSFAKDNWRFDPDRFLNDLQVSKKTEDHIKYD